MGTVALIVSVGGVILGIINHKRIRSNCCGKKLEASLDIGNSSPDSAKQSAVVLAEPPPEKKEDA